MLTGLLLLSLTMNTSPFENLFIGTYTSEHGSKGIYRLQLDTKTGNMSSPVLVAETKSPSYLTLDKDHKVLVAVNELDHGMLSSFTIQPDLALKAINSQSTHGNSPCHLSLSFDHKHVFAANYGDGTLVSLPVHTNGTLGESEWNFANTGSGPNHDRQQGPHAHAIYTDVHHKFVYTCDLGTDELLVFPLAQGKSFPVEGPQTRIKVHQGAGPRHAAMSPDGKHIYVCGELDNTVMTLKVNSPSDIEEVQSLSTLPSGTAVHSSNTAEIICHSSGKWVYVTNRGHDSIAVYKVMGDGKLEPVEIKKLVVKVPRGIEIDPSGSWLVAGGQTSNDLESLHIDPITGKLSSKGHLSGIASPVSILFVK